MKSVAALAVEACVQKPKPLSTVYEFVQAFRPETADETIRARLYEAVEEGKVVRVARGVYFAQFRSGAASGD